jgi:hypothetical protein
MRPQKITFGDIREMGVRGVLIYCADYHCSHSVTLSAERWPDELRLGRRAAVRLRQARRGWSGQTSVGETRPFGRLGIGEVLREPVKRKAISAHVG